MIHKHVSRLHENLQGCQTVTSVNKQTTAGGGDYKTFCTLNIFYHMMANLRVYVYFFKKMGSGKV